MRKIQTLENEINYEMTLYVSYTGTSLLFHLDLHTIDSHFRYGTRYACAIWTADISVSNNS